MGSPLILYNNNWPRATRGGMGFTLYGDLRGVRTCANLVVVSSEIVKKLRSLGFFPRVRNKSAHATTIPAYTHTTKP